MNACKFPDLFKNEHINHMSIEDGCTYHENGQLASKITYKDGVADGPYERYHENGQLASKVIYKDDRWEGPSEYYLI